MTITTRRRVALVCLALVAAAAIWLRVGRLPDQLLPVRESSTVVVDRNGVPLYEARSEAGTRAAPLSAAALPDALVNATIAAEDRRFFLHPGVDPIAIVRATARNARAWRSVEGASTISQQVIKLLLDRRHSPARARGIRAKVYEAVLALRLECTVEELIKTIHAHPTFSEAVGEAAHATHGAAIHA